MHYVLSKYSPKISSKILYKPGTKVTSLQFIPTSSSYTHINCIKTMIQKTVLLHKSLTPILHKVNPYCQQGIVVHICNLNTYMKLRKENCHNLRPIWTTCEFNASQELQNEILSQKKKTKIYIVMYSIKNGPSKLSIYNSS